MKIQLGIAGISHVGAPDVSWLTADDTVACPTPYALLVPGGAAHRPEKRWPAEHYAALAKRLVESSITPLLIGTKAEEYELQAIAAAVPQAINLCGTTSLAQLATLARSATLAVGNDTGPMHIIAASQCPSTVLFSHASDPARSAPVGKSVNILHVPDLRDLPVDRVLASLTVGT
jgi:ADP-heptose:LPS heptosyltransferase